jgi:hypothetical protein
MMLVCGVYCHNKTTNVKWTSLARHAYSRECIVELYCCSVSSLRHVAEEAGEGPLALKLAGGLQMCVCVCVCVCASR